jgi:hypothetical protein
VSGNLLEHRAGIEPANTGFADQRVSHFATGAHDSAARVDDTRQNALRLLLRLGRGAEVRLHGFVAGEDLVGIFVGNGTGDDDVLTLLPVGWRCDFMLRGQLDGVEYADDFVEVAAGGHGVSDLELDALVGANDEDGANGGVVGGSTTFAGLACIGCEHVIELGDLQLGVADEWVVDLVSADIFDVLLPLAVAVDGVDGEADDLGVALRELLFEACHGAELGGADGREVLGVGEENGPAVPDPFMEVDCALRGLGGEIGSNIVDAE